jgi:hypothetical protein
VIACSVTVPPPHVVPRPAPPAPPTSGCELEPTCGPGCFDFDSPHNRDCLARVVTRPRGGIGPVAREVVVLATEYACIADEQCAVVKRSGCRVPRCPTVMPVGSRVPRCAVADAASPRGSAASCGTTPTHARCVEGRCAGVLTTLEVVF